MKKIFEINGFHLKEIIFDGVLYFDLSALPEGKAHWIRPLARSLQWIERLPLLNRIFCNQVKYVTVSREKPATEAGGPCRRKKTPPCQADMNGSNPISSCQPSPAVTGLAWVVARAISFLRKNALANCVLMTGYVLFLTVLLLPFSLMVLLARRVRCGR